MSKENQDKPEFVPGQKKLPVYDVAGYMARKYNIKEVITYGGYKERHSREE